VRSADRRRHLFTALVALLGAAVGCDAGPSPASRGPGPTAPATPAATTGERPGPLAFRSVEVITGGARADERLPLVIALHGLGDRPDDFARLFNDFPGRARFVLPEPRTTHGAGFSWFAFRRGDAEFSASEVRERAAELVAFAEGISARRPTVGRPVFTGFSQGGALSFAALTFHGERLAAAVPVGGWLAPSLATQRARAGAAPLHAVHGADDVVVTVDRSRSAVEALRGLGFEATLVEISGVGHSIPAPVRHALFERLLAALPAPPR